MGDVIFVSLYGLETERAPRNWAGLKSFQSIRPQHKGIAASYVVKIKGMDIGYWVACGIDAIYKPASECLIMRDRQ